MGDRRGGLRLIGDRDAQQPTQVSVNDLRRAWTEATQDNRSASSGDSGATRWRHPDVEQVLPVIGCAGSVGTTIVTLALAASSDRTTRVVECCALSSSGLTSACEAELGTKAGWRRGLRDGRLIERSDRDAWFPDLLPQPSPFPAGEEQRPNFLTILDIGWRAGALLARPTWVARSVFEADAVVAVTSASVPGLRQLEQTVRTVGAERCVAAVVGPRRRRWTTAVRAEIGPQVACLLETDRLITVPVDPRLAVAGPSPSRLPHSVLAAGRDLITASRMFSSPCVDLFEGDLP